MVLFTPVPIIGHCSRSYSFIVPCAANDVLRWRVANVYTSTGSGGYLLDGYNHIKYDAVDVLFDWISMHKRTYTLLRNSKILK